MCGIAGFSTRDGNYHNKEEFWTHVLANMHGSFMHRGPDDQGVYLAKRTGLAHARLAIRDIAGGRQPIVRTYGGKEYAIAYNGELYNTEEIKKDLETLGYTFSTKTDTEVVLTAYVHYGADFVEKLNGIFAFAIWDENRGNLYLFRDRLGIKPLFYTVYQDTLVFASEIKGLFQFPGIEAKLDEQGVCEIFAMGPARTPGQGVFKDFKDVLPGHFVVYNQNGLREFPYWQLKSKYHKDNYEDTVDYVSYLVKDAITRQMVSDVPVCAFLSGGVDSSIVTAVAAKHLQQTGKTLNTFSFDFQGNDDFFQQNDFQPDRDRPWVDKMVAHCQTNHTYLECNNEDLAQGLFAAVDAKDLPGMADVDSSLLYFCGKVARFNKVTLTGECADEIFGGYPWFHKKEMFEKNHFPWTNMDERKKLLGAEVLHTVPIDAYAQARYDESIAKTPVLEGETGEEKRRRELAYLNLKWFMATLLDRMDRTSMYAGLEARVPFADHRIIEYVFNVPWEIKCKGGMVKHLLRKATEDILPYEVLYRKKSPYPKTYNPGYEKILVEWLYDIMASPNEPLHTFVDREKVLAFLTAPSNTTQPWYGQLMAGPQMMAYLVQINYWLKKYSVSVQV